MSFEYGLVTNKSIDNVRIYEWIRILKAISDILVLAETIYDEVHLM